MRILMALIQLVTESLRPGRSGSPGSRPASDTYLRPLVMLMIGLIAGPDLFAFVELTTIFEILGAALFLLSFAVGFRMLGVAALDSLRRFFLPVEYVALLNMRGIPSARFLGALLLFRISCRRALLMYCYCVLACAGVCEILHF